MSTMSEERDFFKQTVPQFLSDSLPGPSKYQATHHVSLSSASKAES